MTFKEWDKQFTAYKWSEDRTLIGEIYFFILAKWFVKN